MRVLKFFDTWVWSLFLLSMCKQFHIISSLRKTIIFVCKLVLLFSWREIVSRFMLLGKREKLYFLRRRDENVCWQGIWYHGQELSFRRSGQETQEKTQDEHLKTNTEVESYYFFPPGGLNSDWWLSRGLGQRKKMICAAPPPFIPLRTSLLS
jgi:hypothetical protein